MKIKHLLFAVSVGSVVLLGCKKDQSLKFAQNDEISGLAANVVVSDSRLSFKSLEEFDKTLSAMEERPNEIKAELKKIGFRKIDRKEVPYIAKQVKTQSNRGEAVSKAVETIIDSELLVENKSLVNIFSDNLEVEVSGVIYKVTPYGTFITTIENYASVKKIAADYSMENLTLSDEIDYSLYLKPKVDEDTYEVAPGVLLYDTYGVTRTVGMNQQSNLEETGIMETASTASLSSSEVGSGNYGSLPKITYEKHTVVGKIWSGIFGGANNEVYTSNFKDNNNRRVKVSLYNRNFVVKKVLGLKVKTQKKNWIGWSGTAADEIRLGWDGISFTVKDNNTPANPWPALRSALAPYRPKGSTSNPDWTPNWSDSKRWEVNLLPNGTALDISKGFQKGVKMLYDAARGYQGKTIPKNQESTIIAWLNQNNKTTISIAGPNEISAFNKEELEIQLASFTDFVFTFTINGGNINWQKAAVNSVSSTKDATKMEMQFASIYGVARFGNEWNGAVIEKSK